MSTLTNEFITIWLPRRWFLGGSIELIIEQTKGLLAAESIPGEQRTIADCEFDFYVHAIRRTSLHERRPQPIVHIVVRYIAHHVTPPIDALVEVCEGFLHPLQSRKNNES